jgi:hypothetical protein
MESWQGRLVQEGVRRQWRTGINKSWGLVTALEGDQNWQQLTEAFKKQFPGVVNGRLRSMGKRLMVKSYLQIG